MRGEQHGQEIRLFDHPGLEKVERLGEIAKRCKERGLEELYNSIRKN